MVSPKLVNSGMSYRRRIVPAALTGMMATGRAAFTFVVTDPDTDFAEIAALVEEWGLAPVWVMPEGATREKVLARMDAIMVEQQHRRDSDDDAKRPVHASPTT